MSSYETDSSAFTDYDGEVLSASFQVSERDGRPQIVLVMGTNDPDIAQWTERYNLATTSKGGTWEIVENGEEVLASDLSTRFRDNGAYGKFISAAVKAAHINPKTGVDKDGKEWGDTKEAKTWLGTCWHMEAVKGEFKNRETGEDVTWSKNYPSVYLGMGDEGKIQYDDTSGSEPHTSSHGSQDGGTALSVEAYEKILAPLSPSQLSELMTSAKIYSHEQWMDLAVETCLETLTDPDLRVKFVEEISKPTGGLYDVMKG